MLVGTDAFEEFVGFLLGVGSFEVDGAFTGIVTLNLCRALAELTIGTDVNLAVSYLVPP